MSSFWPQLPPGVDAAYEIPEKDEMVIFKGKMLSFCFPVLSSQAA